MDVPAGLVELSATIIDFTNGSVRDLGVEWQHAGKTSFAGADAQVLHGQTFSNLAGATAENPRPAPATPVLLEGYSFSTLVGQGSATVMARIRALEKTGKARINARPGVLTFDNLQAHIAHTQSFHVRVAGERDANLFQLESGTVLRVTPHIIEEEGEKSVRLVVEIEDGSLSRDELVDNIPTVSTSTVNTQAVVGDEESLLLGGFIRTEEGVSTSQVPLLGSIPLLGHLFKRSTRTRTRVERIFMITPRIIESPGEAGRLFEEDDKERRFQKSLVPDERSSVPAWKRMDEVPVRDEAEKGSWAPR
jgi:type III secretion protein C